MDLSRVTTRRLTGTLGALAVVASLALGGSGLGARGHHRDPASVAMAATPVGTPVNATPAMGTPVGADVVAVDIRDDDYEPGGLRLTVGERVRWVNRDGVTHTVSADDDAFDSGPMHRGEAFTHTFNEPGTFSYSCDLHLEMAGAVVVRER